MVLFILDAYNEYNFGAVMSNILTFTSAFLSKGYLDLSKENMKDNSNETSGTPGYISPEVMKSLNHSSTRFYNYNKILYIVIKNKSIY